MLPDSQGREPMTGQLAESSPVRKRWAVLRGIAMFGLPPIG